MLTIRPIALFQDLRHRVMPSVNKSQQFRCKSSSIMPWICPMHTFYPSCAYMAASQSHLPLGCLSCPFVRKALFIICHLQWYKGVGWTPRPLNVTIATVYAPNRTEDRTSMNEGQA